MDDVELERILLESGELGNVASVLKQGRANIWSMLGGFMQRLCPEAAKAAKQLVRMIAPALTRAERKMYLRKAYAVCSKLRGRRSVIGLLAESKN